MDATENNLIKVEVVEVRNDNFQKNEIIEIETEKKIKVEVVEIIGIQGPPGGSGGLVGLMKPDPREFFLALLGGELPDIPNIPDVPDIPDEPDITLPILGSARLNTMVLA